MDQAVAECIRSMPKETLRLLHTRVKSIWPYSIEWNVTKFKEQEINDWCEENLQDAYLVELGYVGSKIYLVDEYDATVVALKFGGNCDKS